MTSPRLLIIDDDERLTRMLAEYLSERGFIVESRATAAAGLAAAAQGDWSAIVLDVMLPDGDGFELCRQLRSRSAVPIVMLTARGAADDRIVGLELGADDYLPKPFNARELLARLRAVIRRGRLAQEETLDGVAPIAPRLGVLRIGAIVIDRDARSVLVRGEETSLTAHQYALLLVLAERQGRVQTREQLMEAVRGQELEAFDRSIDVHVSRIRAAIELDPRRPRYLKTVRGAGYVMTAGGEGR